MINKLKPDFHGKCDSLKVKIVYLESWVTGAGPAG